MSRIGDKDGGGGRAETMSVPLPASSTMGAPLGGTWLIEIAGVLLAVAAGVVAGAGAAGFVAAEATVTGAGDGVCAALPDTNWTNADAAIRPVSQRDITTPTIYGFCTTEVTVLWPPRRIVTASASTFPGLLPGLCRSGLTSLSTV